MSTSTSGSTPGTHRGGVHVRARLLTRHHAKAGAVIRILDGVDFDLRAGDRVAVVGPSGSGKSTFLHLLGLLDAPTSGEIWLDDVAVHTLTSNARARLRNERIGYVFQAHNLLPELDAVGNVAMPVRLAGAPPAVARARALVLLDAVGLSHRLTHRPGELSGGEQQRVAIARALVMAPGLVLADEPTGNLDPHTAQSVFELLLDLNRALGSTLVVVTHSRELADRFPRRASLEGGRFVLS
jgi:lipoprotein-releasing system ATP-binding protein